MLKHYVIVDIYDIFLPAGFEIEREMEDGTQYKTKFEGLLQSMI